MNSDSFVYHSHYPYQNPSQRNIESFSLQSEPFPSPFLHQRNEEVFKKDQIERNEKAFLRESFFQQENGYLDNCSITFPKNENFIQFSQGYRENYSVSSHINYCFSRKYNEEGIPISTADCNVKEIREEHLIFKTNILSQKQCPNKNIQDRHIHSSSRTNFQSKTLETNLSFKPSETQEIFWQYEFQNQEENPYLFEVNNERFSELPYFPKNIETSEKIQHYQLSEQPFNEQNEKIKEQQVNEMRRYHNYHNEGRRIDFGEKIKIDKQEKQINLNLTEQQYDLIDYAFLNQKRDLECKNQIPQTKVISDNRKYFVNNLTLNHNGNEINHPQLQVQEIVRDENNPHPFQHHYQIPWNENLHQQYESSKEKESFFYIASNEENQQESQIYHQHLTSNQQYNPYTQYNHPNFLLINNANCSNSVTDQVNLLRSPQSYDQKEQSTDITNNLDSNKSHYSLHPSQSFTHIGSQYQIQEDSKEIVQLKYIQEVEVVMKKMPIENENIYFHYENLHKNQTQEKLSSYYNQKESTPLANEEQEEEENSQDQINEKHKKDSRSEEDSAENDFKIKAEQQECIQLLSLIKKKNVAKNIMTAFKNFITHPMKFGYTAQQVQASLNQYNLSKNKEETIEEMKSKFVKYIMKKKFNHYTIKLLILHPNYRGVFEYFLNSLSDFWLDQSKVQDMNAHLAMIQFLKQSFKDTEIISQLKKYDKRKNN